MALDAGHGPAVLAVRARYKGRHGRERLEQMHAEGPIEFRSTGMPFASALPALISIVIPVDPEHRCPPGVMLILVAMKAKATDGLKPTHSRCISLSIFGDVR